MTMQIVERRPLITDAVLYLLRIMPMAAEEIAELINRDTYTRFEPLRQRWGKLNNHQVYAAMSGLRSKRNPERCFIEPIDGPPADWRKYQITTAGRGELLRRIQEGKFTLPDTKDRPSTGKNKMFEDIPNEHPYLRLDEKVRVLDQRSVFCGLVGTIGNIRLGDRAYVAVEFDKDTIHKARAGRPAHSLGRHVGDAERGSYMSYMPTVELVPLRDEHEMLIGDWSFTARIARHYSTGVAEKIIVTGPTLREGDAIFPAEDFLKDTPADALAGAINKAFITLVGPKLIARTTAVEDALLKLSETRLAL